MLNGLGIEESVKDDIRNAVSAGHEATVHQQAISYHGFNGTGYLLIDPETGAGGYKISGGADGGSLSGTRGGKFLRFFGEVVFEQAITLGPINLAIDVALTMAIEAALSNPAACLSSDQRTSFSASLNQITWFGRAGLVAPGGLIFDVATILGLLYLASFVAHVVQINRAEGSCNL
ncbi:MAG: hypothetical protein ACRD5H_08470 [Nitrososphaerales archaeon]